ncbi:MAG: tripartite tricarboxylate transporter TctB family protein [Elusimicrobiota bacterium]|jgi:hypothetical protein|nr:tripartite tricarboxylate transporter TctB family protein [Elusimicrobiota bacterium]
MKQNQLIAVVFIVFAVITIFLTFGFENSVFGNDYSGPGFFPRICAIAMIILSALLLFQNRHEQPLKNMNLTFLKIPAIGLASLIIYVLLLKIIGFTISSFILIVVLLRLFGVKKPITIPFFAVLISWIVNYVFNDLLTVSLPEGLLPQKLQIIFPAAVGVYIIVLAIIHFNKRGK